MERYINNLQNETNSCFREFYNIINSIFCNSTSSVSTETTETVETGVQKSIDLEFEKDLKEFILFNDD